MDYLSENGVKTRDTRCYSPVQVGLRHVIKYWDAIKSGAVLSVADFVGPAREFCHTGFKATSGLG